MTGLSIALMGLLLLSIILNIMMRRAMVLMARHFAKMIDATNEALDLLAEARMYVAKEQEAAKGSTVQ
jgi:hypothetical protein